MTIKLSPQLKADLTIINTTFTQKQQAKILTVSINKIMSLRKEAGLPGKEKGRPKGASITFKSQPKYNKQILSAAQRLRDTMIQYRYDQQKGTNKLTKEEIEKQYIPLEKLM